MSTTLDILHIEDSEDDFQLTGLALKKLGYELYHRRVCTMPEINSALHERKWDLVLSDYNLPEVTMEDALELTQQVDQTVPFILVTGAMGEEAAVDLIHKGVHDVVLKDNLPRLVSVIIRNLREAGTRQEVEAAQQSLQETQARYRTLWETSSTGYFLLHNGIIVDCNQTVSHHFKYPKNHIIGKAPIEFSPEFQPDGKRSDELVQMYIERAAGGADVNFRWAHVASDDSIIYHDINLRHMQLGKRWLIVAALRNVTEQVMAEEKLHLQDRALQCTNNGVIICRYEGQNNPITWANTAFLHISGYSMAEVLGKDCRFMHAEDRDQEGLDEIRDAINEGRSATVIVRNYRKNGEQIWVEILIDPVFSDNGKLTHYVGIIRDISERVANKKAAERNESLLRQAGNIARVGGWDLDLVTNELYWSDVTRRLHEVPADYTPTVEKAVLFYPQPSRDTLVETLNRSIETGAPYDVEVQFTTAKGKQIWVRVIGQPVQVDGKTVSIHGCIQDITERRTHLESIERNRRRLALAVEVGRVGVWDFDIAKQRFRYDKSWYSLFGYTSEDNISSVEALVARVSKEDQEPSLAELKRLSAGEIETGGAEYGFADKKGDIRRVLSQGQLIRDAEGVPTQIIGITWDITERWRSQEQLRIHQRLIDQSPDSVVVTDTLGNITYVNTTFTKRTGYSREEAIGANPRILKSGEVDEKVYREMWETITRGKEWHGELINKAKDGTLYWENALIFPIRDAEGRITHYAAEKQDITELKKHEEEREALNQQVMQLQRMETIGTLAGGIAHDFNNLLAVIRGWAELARNHAGGNDKVLEDIKHVLIATKRARALVEQILTFSRETKLKMHPLDPGPIIKEAIKMMHSTIPAYIQVVSKIEPDLGNIYADPGQFHQIIYNLCLNAVQAMGETPGTLEVILSKQTMSARLFPKSGKSDDNTPEEREYICLSVTDTGPGIAAEHRDRLYEPFFTTKPVGEGTGLGLAVVHGIVTAHGGMIELESELGVGTTFQVFIPLHTGDEDTYQDVETEPLRGDERIMLVDDEKELTEVMMRHLKGLGYRIEVFSSSIDALAAFQKAPAQYDIILTDQVMPEMSGVELIRSVRESAPDQPIVLMTGFSKSVDQGKIDGFCNLELIMKPYSLSELTHAIKRLVRNKTLPQ